MDVEQEEWGRNPGNETASEVKSAGRRWIKVRKARVSPVKLKLAPLDRACLSSPYAVYSYEHP
jgi:hypothetical protein